MQGLNAIANSNKSTDFSDMDSMLDTYIESIASKDPNSNSFSGISTSFAGLDDITNGLQKSDLILLKTQGDDNASKELKNEYQIEIPKISILFTPFLNLVALQILAYETAKLLHDNIDEPRDLKKCVSAE